MDIIIMSVLGVCFFIGLAILLKSLYLVQQAETIIIERMGKYDRILTPGVHIVVPFIETPRLVRWTFLKEGDAKRYSRYLFVSYRIDLRESVYDFPKQNVITRDNVTIEISAILYYQINDVYSAVYAVADLPDAIEKLTQTTLRNVIGSMDLDETLVSRDNINTRLRIILDEASLKWGMHVNRVELQEINPPHDIRHAMEKQMRAERDRRAVILEAEGAKSAAILTAEGECESQIQRARGIAESKVIQAQGEAEARLRNTQAEAQALEYIAKALPKHDPAAYLIAQQYIKMLPQMTEGKDSKVIVLPYEATAIMGSLSGIKKMFEELS